MSRPLLLTVLAASFALPARAQDYDVVATQSDLADGGTLADPEPRCLDYRAAEGDFVFFDDTNDLLATYDPSASPGDRTSVLRTAAELDADAGVDVVVCRDLDTDDDGNVYAALSPADNLDLVYRSDAGGAAGAVLAAGSVADGVTGLVVDGTTVWLARAQFFGAPEDGVYRINATGAGQTPTEVVTDPDLDLTGIDVSDSGDLYATSSEFGVGDFANVIVKVEDPDGSADLSIVGEPCDGGPFENCGDGGIEDLKVGVRSGSERLFVFNNSFGAAEGEEAAQFDLDGSDPVTVFLQGDFLADSDISGAGVTEYTPGGTGNGYMDYDEATGTLYLAGSSSFDGTPGIFSASLGGGTPTEPGAPGAAFALAVWPNPAVDAAAVRVTVDAPQTLEVAAYDRLGRRVALLFRGTALAGTPVTAHLDASALPAGVYVVRAIGEAGEAARRVTVVR